MAALEALYAMSWIWGVLLACQELEANSLDTLRMTACVEARTRGKNSVIGQSG